MNSILLRRIVLDICVIENNFQNRFSKIQMQQQMNNIQKMNNEKNKDKKNQTNKLEQKQNKTAKDSFIVVIHHYLIYKKKVFSFLIVTKHQRLVIDHLK